jgi:hypothetical protein
LRAGDGRSDAVRIVIGELIGMRLAHPAGSSAESARAPLDHAPLFLRPPDRELVQREPAAAGEELAPFEELRPHP